MNAAKTLPSARSGRSVVSSKRIGARPFVSAAAALAVGYCLGKLLRR